MKKIILLAIMLGLVGCGENGSSDVTSPENIQSTELTSNSMQQASARSISAYSMTVPFGGWSLSNPTALGASALYEGIKDALTSTAVLTADASQVAKVLGKGVAGYALSVAVEQLLGAVDWVLDPANNQIKYTIPSSDPNDPTVQTIYTLDTARKNIYAVTMDQACSKAVGVYFNSSITSAYYNQNTKTCWVRGLYFGNEYVADSGKFLFTLKNPLYDPNAKPEEKKLPLETVAQKVIENADAGSLDAQVATMAAAAQILEDAANDEEIEQEIVDQLEKNAKCPSGIMSEKGQCWECTKEDYPVIAQRTKLAKAETARLGKCLPEMDNTALFIRINAFNEFVQARVNENSCWAPLDPGHVQQEQDGRNGALKCTNYLK